MAYAGYLVKIGNYEVPFHYINHNTYRCVWEKLVFGSYEDANGELHEDGVSERKRMVVSWETPNLSDNEMQTLLSSIKTQLIDQKVRNCNVTAYMPLEDTYKTDKCRMSNIQFTIRHADQNTLRYNPAVIEFIGYVTSSAK